MGEQRHTGSNEVIDRLFVYGSLREGQAARSLIANQILRCEKAWATGALYVLPTGYGGVIEADAPHLVVGEVLWLTELAATFGLLDAYEGHDYARVISQVTLDTGEVMWCWIYVLADPDAVQHGRLIEHGDWVRHVREQG